MKLCINPDPGRKKSQNYHKTPQQKLRCEYRSKADLKNNCYECMKCICPCKREEGRGACLHCSSAWGSLTNGINEDVLVTPLQGSQQGWQGCTLISSPLIPTSVLLLCRDAGGFPAAPREEKTSTPLQGLLSPPSFPLECCHSMCTQCDINTRRRKCPV